MSFSSQSDSPNPFLGTVGAFGASFIAWFAAGVVSILVALIIMAIANAAPEGGSATSVSRSMFLAIGMMGRSASQAHFSGKSAMALPILLSLPCCTVAAVYGVTSGFLSRIFRAVDGVATTLLVLWGLAFLADVWMNASAFSSYLDQLSSQYSYYSYGYSSLKSEISSVQGICWISTICALIAVPYTLFHTFKFGRGERDL